MRKIMCCFICPIIVILLTIISFLFFQENTNAKIIIAIINWLIITIQLIGFVKEIKEKYDN